MIFESRCQDVVGAERTLGEDRSFLLGEVGDEFGSVVVVLSWVVWVIEVYDIAKILNVCSFLCFIGEVEEFTNLMICSQTFSCNAWLWKHVARVSHVNSFSLVCQRILSSHLEDSEKLATARFRMLCEERERFVGNRRTTDDTMERLVCRADTGALIPLLRKIGLIWREQKLVECLEVKIM